MIFFYCLIPNCSTIDGAGDVGEVLNYRGYSTFLDYQEGKPFNSEHNFLNVIIDSQGTTIV